jgi:hypothetical protein
MLSHPTNRQHESLDPKICFCYYYYRSLTWKLDEVISDEFSRLSRFLKCLRKQKYLQVHKELQAALSVMDQ